jgi:serine/threonine protein kinase
LYQLSRNYCEADGNTEQSDSELVFISMISSGAFGEVWKDIHRGDIVAIKMMKLERIPNDQLQFIQAVLIEAKRDMKDDRGVQFIGLVMPHGELMPHGALSTFIAKSGNTMKWSTRYQMMHDICEGMAYLHSTTHADGSEKKELFHQDLKSANVLLTEVDGIIRAKIGDFGLSCMLFKSSNYLNLVMKQAEKGATRWRNTMLSGTCKLDL